MCVLLLKGGEQEECIIHGTRRDNDFKIANRAAQKRVGVS